MYLVKNNTAGAKTVGNAAHTRAALVRKIAPHASAEGLNPTAIPELILSRRSVPSYCASATYEPGLILFFQGKKRINVGKTTYLCGDSSLLLTSVDLPVVSQVIKASQDEPMLATILRLDMTIVRELLNKEDFDSPDDSSSDTHGMSVSVASEEILDAFSRLMNLLDTPADIPFLSGLIEREIIYRVLRSSQGKHLRAIATAGDQKNRVAKAASWLKDNYTKPLRVEELAEVARMGISTFHTHFRSLTAMSPIQYQKQIRLNVARQRMLSEGVDAATAAFEVGYESASQFNREYSRLFGQPPMRDVKAHRVGTAFVPARQ
jgi:AraC-like DNA-binding protein